MSDHLKKYVDYINNTGRRPLPVAMFDEDWEPAGPMIREQLRDAGLIEELAGGLTLVDAQP